MKNMIKRIREAKTWQERARIAEDKRPGTKFDPLFELVESAHFFATIFKSPADRQIRLQTLGQWLATVIEAGKSQELHDLASALNIWRHHKPKPDIVLVTLFSMAGMFYPGWEKDWIDVDHASGRILGRGVPAGTRIKLATRDFIRNLRRTHFPHETDREWKQILQTNQKRWEKKFRRYAKIIGCQLDDQGGRPSLKRGQHSQ